MRPWMTPGTSRPLCERYNTLRGSALFRRHKPLRSWRMSRQTSVLKKQLMRTNQMQQTWTGCRMSSLSANKTSIQRSGYGQRCTFLVRAKMYFLVTGKDVALPYLGHSTVDETEPNAAEVDRLQGVFCISKQNFHPTFWVRAQMYHYLTQVIARLVFFCRS